MNVKTLWYYLEILYTRLLSLFGIRRSTAPIPKDTVYCYELDKEKGIAPDGYYIKPCKYYRHIMKNDDAACVYTGFIGFDPCLSDSCKICGIGQPI